MSQFKFPAKLALVSLLATTLCFVSVAKEDVKFEKKPTSVHEFTYNTDNLLVIIATYLSYTQIQLKIKNTEGRQKADWIENSESILNLRQQFGRILLSEFLSQAKKAGIKFPESYRWKVQATKDFNWMAIRLFEDRKIFLSVYVRIETNAKINDFIEDREKDFTVKLGKTYIWDYRK